MRNRFADVFYQLGKDDPRMAIVVADISPAGSIAKFREEFPDRFINTGVAEQVMIGMCAGMAQRGMKPWAYTIATFTLYRPFEFVRDDLCYQHLPVTIVGIGGGVTYSTLGGTHHAMEDIGIATSLPGMQVIAPCDPDEAEVATHWCAKQTNGPVYLRLGKAGEPTVTQDADPWEFGKLRYLSRGSDICILTYGPIVTTALKVAEAYRERGQSVSVVSCHTLKPLDEAGIATALADHKKVVVVEETTPQGSIGYHVKRIAWECRARAAVETFCLQDKFIHAYGSHADVLAAHGLDPKAIVERLAI